MNCNNARKTTYLSEYPEVVDQDVLEAKRHIKECRECRKFIEGEKSFGSLLRNTVKKETAPAEPGRLRPVERIDLKNAYRQIR